MKKLLSILLFSVSVLAFSQENEGISFIEDPEFTELLKMAKEQNKPVFIDCYAKWCGPCKHLANNVFPKPEAGAYFNEHFINVKYDMEKEQGGKIQGRFNVSGYPTLLFLNSDGDLIFKSIGAEKRPEDLIKLAEKALDPNNNYASMLRKMNGNAMNIEITREDIRTFLYKENPQNPDYYLSKYIELLDDSSRYSKETFEVLSRFTSYMESEASRYLLKNEEKFRAQIKDDKVVDQGLMGIFSSVVYSYESLKRMNNPLIAKAKLGVEVNMAAMEYKQNRDSLELWQNMIGSFDNYFKTVDVSNMMINNVAWDVYENYKQFNDKEALKLAKVWCEKAIEEDRNMYIIDTYAAIVFELGDVKKAIELQEEAVVKIQEGGESDGFVRAYKKRLEEFKKAL